MNDSMNDSLEKRLSEREFSTKDKSSIDSKFVDSNSLNPHSNSEPKKTSKLKILGSAIMTTGIIAATIPFVGLNSVYTTFGNGIGYLVEKKKNKEKFKGSEFLKELYTGAVMGLVGTGIYTAIDKVPVEGLVSPLENVAPKYYGIIKNVAKTFVFNPGLLIPYLAFYKGFTYLRDNFSRIRKEKKGILKETYNEGIKKDYWGGVGKLLKLFPIHYVNVNYITNIPTRIMVGVGNDILFRLFQKKESKSSADSLINNPARSQFESPYRAQNTTGMNYRNPALAGSYA